MWLVIFTSVNRAAPGPTIAELRQDLQFFARELPRRHINAFHYTPRAGFEAAISALDKQLDSLDADQFYVGLMRIAAMCGSPLAV